MIPFDLYVLTKDDVDSVLEGRDIGPDARNDCYDAVRDMDSSAIFETIEVICDLVLSA